MSASKSVTNKHPDSCPCGSGHLYRECCEPLHDGQAPETAERLMRARYCAYAKGLPDFVFRSWHPKHRPERVDLAENPEWVELRVLRTEAGQPDDVTGMVEFEADYLMVCHAEHGDGSGHHHHVGTLHEVSTFGRRGGRWVYVDGDVLSE